MNNWFLGLILDSIIEELVGKRVTSCRYLKPIFSLEMGGDEPRGGAKLFLVSILSSPGPFLFLSESDPFFGYDAPQAILGVTGCLVRIITQHEDQRIAVLQLEKRGGIRASLYICLFGRMGSVYFVEEDRITRGIAIRKTDQLPWGSRKTLSFATISNTELGAALRQRIPVAGLNDSLVDCCRGMDPDKTASHLIKFRDSLRGRERPFAIISIDKPSKASPFPFAGSAWDGAEGFAGPFTSPAEAARHLGERALRKTIHDIISSQMKPLRRLQKSKRELLEKLRRDLHEAKHHATMRKEGETLAAFHKRLKPGIRSVELPDPYNEESSVIIKLDPSRSIQEEIESRFKSAAKMKRSLPTLQRRIHQVKKELKDLAGTIEEIAGKEDLKPALASLDRAFKSWKIEPRGKIIKRPEKEKSYRRFDLGRDWFVLVGRSNRENDELTFSVASPGDIWMHAQGVPGSHIILKSKGHQENPPAATLEAAAGIAAFYSKAKHSSIVPVIYTRRKYVRKPRKAQPGQVLCSNEKTIFATPSIPQEPKKRNDNENRGT